MKIAFCFAGQGSQAKGMGKDFYDNIESVKTNYDAFPQIRDLCFNDENNQLDQTAYAQKAMLLTGYAIAKALEEQGISPEYALGLSLGEYTALAFSDVWDINDSIDIITNRGEIMQNALPLGTSKMAAVIGLDRDKIKSIISNASGVCEIANYNCPGQIVITGDKESIDYVMPLLSEAGALKVVELNVSGAFHSSLLNDASIKLRAVLDKYNPHNPKYKIVYNISGKEEDMNLNDILQRQICNSVYFEDSIRYLLDQGVDTFIEIGPGKALSGFIKRIDRKVSIYNVSDYQGYLSLLEKFNA